MLISDGNENNNKNQWSNQQTNIFARAANFFVQYISLPLLLHDYNAKLSRYRFYGGNVVCAHKKICCLGSCSLFFSLPLIFSLLATSISHLLPAVIKFSFCFPTKFVFFVFCLSLQFQFSECMNKCLGLEDNNTRPLYILTY